MTGAVEGCPNSGGIHLKRNLKLLATATFCLLCAAPVLADFTQADLDKTIKELDAILPRDPLLDYPIKASIKEDKRENAYSWVEKQTGTERKRAIVVVYTGLIKYFNADHRLLRAVLAHEVSHLSRGHCSGYAFIAKDLNNLYTRQQEFEADISGAAALQRLGYSKKDLIDMLMKFEALHGREGNWWDNLTADHADSKARAAEIADDPMVLRSLVSFDIGLAFCDSRRWNLAGRFFDEAIQKEPNFPEAYINSGYAALMYYYDLLPSEVTNRWLRPDFGPLLKIPTPTIRAAAVDDTDRNRWRNAVAKINKAIEKAPASPNAKELLALAQVLEPDADKSTVQKGIDAFKSMMASTSDGFDRLRYANNACVGYDRIGNLDAGYAAIMDAQRKTTYFVRAVGENLGRINVKSRSKEDEQLAADVMFTWLQKATTMATNRGLVEEAYKASMRSLGQTPSVIAAPALSFVRAASIWVDNKELGLFRPVTEVEQTMGKADLKKVFEDKFPDLFEERWKAGNFSILAERGQVMRVTTYEPNTYLFLQPKERSSSRGFKVTVGMSVDDMKVFLDPSSGVEKKLVGRTKMETWTYFEDLGFGVLIEDKKLAGVTVTPVEYEEK
jgi:tetratricopeptide (TPR) repeat protein